MHEVMGTAAGNRQQQLSYPGRDLPPPIDDPPEDPEPHQPPVRDPPLQSEGNPAKIA